MMVRAWVRSCCQSSRGPGAVVRRRNRSHRRGRSVVVGSVVILVGVAIGVFSLEEGKGGGTPFLPSRPGNQKAPIRPSREAICAAIPCLHVKEVPFSRYWESGQSQPRPSAPRVYVSWLTGLKQC